MSSFKISLIILFTGSTTWAWGGRGHDAICQSAVFLVKSSALKEYLLNKPHMMGHLCNIPDIHWRNLPNEQTQHGNPTHYVNPEIVGLSTQTLPTEIKDIIQKYTGQENMIRMGSKISSIPMDMGTSWWRADQLFRIALNTAKEVKKATPPSNSKEEQDDNLQYNKYFYDMVVALGIMGHYVGDNAQPFHVSSDYDGYAAGHGGIHAYYEDSSVAYFGPDLHSKIVSTAKKMKKTNFLIGKSTIEKMKKLGEISSNEVKDVLKVDPVIKPSSLKIEKGMSLKTAAVRRSAEVGHQKFEKLILQQMARASLLLAHLWDEVYQQAGSPEVKAYKSYKYPLTPEFIFPDYYEIKNNTSAKPD